MEERCPNCAKKTAEGQCTNPRCALSRAQLTPADVLELRKFQKAFRPIVRLRMRLELRVK